MPENILVINPFGIGDVLFSTPLIRNLRFYYPDAFIAVVAQKQVTPVLENNPSIDKIIPFSRGDFKILSNKSKLRAMGLLFRTLSQIRRAKFDLCIDLSLEHRYSLFLKLLGIKQRIGFNYKQRGRFLTQRINIDGFQDKHVTEYHLELLKFLNKQAKFYQAELFLKQGEKDWAEEFLKQFQVSRQDLLVGIIPGGGASWGKKADYLQWPYESFAKVCDELSRIPHLKVILLGSPTDVKICQSIARFLKQEPIEAFGKTNLRQFIALIDKCQLIICNDTGPLHISAALAKRIIYFCGPVDERVYGAYPARPERVVMKKDFPCRPCYRNFHVPECDYQLRCLRVITPEEVITQAKRLIENPVSSFGEPRAIH